MKRLCISLLLNLLLTVAAGAQRVATVSGEYTFYGEPSMSPKQCEAAAIEGARLAAMAKEFGTAVSIVTVQDEQFNGDRENTFFKQLSESEVRGEWLEDIGAPQITRSLDPEGYLIVTCKIKGRARELSNKAADFIAMVLRNGTDTRYVDTRFKSGDDMRVLFSAPVDGYVTIYLTDDNRMASTLLPYASADGTSVKVKHGTEYVFFDRKLDRTGATDVDEIALGTDDEIEHDRLYVIFSPNRFIKANDSYVNESTPRSLPFNDFHAWLSKMRRNDPEMAVKTFDIVITK